MKVKYKIKAPFGLHDYGEIVNAHILSVDDDSGIALCYHPENKKLHECGSFEFIKNQGDYWVAAFDDKCYVNQGSGTNTNRKFREFLKNIR
jgi:hypothetical protein